MSLFPLVQSWSVTDLTRYIRLKLESDDQLQGVWVQGEVSNLSRPTSGHIYFTLKDSSASLRCVIWRSNASRVRLNLRDGMAVEVHGDLSVYEPAGQYQLYGDLVRIAGEGQLFQEFLRLKEKLEAEGLFDPGRKRPIPPRPKVIGIISSPTGAALQDMLNTIRRRYPLADVYFAPTAVQGDEAPAEIIRAFQWLNSQAHPDVILVARGGGSLEDLWAFNDEHVVRTVATSPAPVISGVGHETDFTLTDFAADLRAPTPTAAAELATPTKEALLSEINDLTGALRQSAASQIADRRWQLRALRQKLEALNPQNQIRSGRQRVDDLSRRSRQAAFYLLQIRRSKLQGVSSRLSAVNPLAVLNRGFALVTRQRDGQIVSEKESVSTGDALDIQVKNGHIGARVLSEEQG